MAGGIAMQQRDMRDMSRHEICPEAAGHGVPLKGDNHVPPGKPRRPGGVSEKAQSASPRTRGGTQSGIFFPGLRDFAGAPMPLRHPAMTGAR